MPRKHDRSTAEASPELPKVSDEPDSFEQMNDAEDITPEQLARIRAENAHLEEGYNPTSSLFSEWGI